MSHYYRLDTGRLLAADADMQNRALSFGDGFFSTLGVHQGQILWAEGHATRLSAGACAFDLEIDTPSLMATLSALAHTLGMGMIKIIIARQAQDLRGYGYCDGRAQIYIKTQAVPLYADSLFISGFPIQPVAHAITLGELFGTRAKRFSGIKLISCHEQIFAHTALLHAQRTTPTLAEALVKNTLGYYVSGTMSNIFYRLDTDWYTPPTTHSGVAGVARQALLTHHRTISERTLNDNDLVHLSALCFTNAVRGISPIEILWHDGEPLSLDADAYLELVR